MRRAVPRSRPERGAGGRAGGGVELAARMLARRPLSEGELAERLARKGIGGAEVPAVIARLRELGWLDDADLCRRLARSFWDDRGYGPAKIAWKLAKRRFSRELVDEAVRRIASPEAVADAAARALRKKFRDGVPPGRDAAAKAYRFLAGRGFPPGACRAAIGRQGSEYLQGDD